MHKISATTYRSISTSLTVRWFIALVLLLALSLGGIWELFRGGAHREHLLLFFLGFLLTGLTVLGSGYLNARQALKEARFSHDRLRSALLAAKSVAWDLDVKTGNDQLFGDLKTLFGISSENATLQTGDFYRRVHQGDRERVTEAVEKAQSDHVPYTSEFRVTHQDGSVRWVSASGEFKYNKKGEPVRMLGMAIDVTEHRKIEQSLIASQAKFAKAFHSSPVALTLTSALDHRYIEVNETFENATGWTRAEVIGRTPLDIGLWVDPSQREDLVERVLKQKSVRNMEIRYRRKDGGQGVALGSGEFMEFEGEPCVLAAIVDITDRQRAEEALRHKQHELAEAQRLGHVGSWECNADGSNMHWSEELYRIYGLDPTQPAPTFENVQKLYTPETWSRLLHAMETRSFPEMEMELIRPDGTKRWIQTRFDVTRESDGTIVSFRGISRDITEEKQTADQLRESEERFRRVVDHIADAIFVDNVEGRAVFANDRFLNLFGFRREQLPSLRLEDLVAPEYQAEVRERHNRRMRGESVAANFQHQAIRVDGTRMWVEVDVVPIVDQQGRITGTQSALRDITERKRAQQAIHDSEQRLRNLIEASNDWVWETDKEGRFTYASAQCRQLLGYEPEEFIGKRPSEVMPADEASRLNEITQKLLAEQKPFFGLQNATIRRDGKLVVWEANGVPVFDQDGTFSGFRGLLRDITERHRAEMELRESEERFRRVVEHIGDALVVDDADGRIVFANDQFLTFFGFRRDELENVTLEDYVAPNYREELRDRHTQRMNGNELGSRYEFEGIRRNGNRLWIQAEVASVEDHQGNIVGSQRLLRDITEQKRAERALRESEERFRLVANTAPVMIWMAGTDKMCNYFNRPWLDFVGEPLSEQLGNGWLKAVHPDDGSTCFRTYVDAFDQREPFEMQYRLRRHDGEYRWVLDFGVPRLNSDRSFAGYIGSCIDITERKQAEEALATIGRRLIEAHEEERTWIGRELHDDINQQLALLSVELDRWLKDHPSKGSIRELIRHAQQRISEVAKDVQSLSHRLHSSKLEYLGLAKAANSFCREVSKNSNVEVTFREAGIPRILPKEISLCLFRVLQEGLQNAVKHSGAHSFTVELYASSNSIELKVQDAGTGFDPVAALGGHGIGLISMRERLQLVHGDLSVQSKPGHGTTIHARIPLEESASHALAG